MTPFSLGAASAESNLPVAKAVWRFSVVVWIGLIFFSSTTLAAQWSESAFRLFARLFFGLSVDTAFNSPLHLLAEKGFHVSLFCVLALLLYPAMSSPQHKAFKVLAFGALIGSCSEFLQRFFPDRDPALRDVAINIAGTGLGLAVHSLLIRFSQKINRTPLPE